MPKHTKLRTGSRIRSKTGKRVCVVVDSEKYPEEDGYWIAHTLCGDVGTDLTHERVPDKPTCAKCLNVFDVIKRVLEGGDK